MTAPRLRNERLIPPHAPGMRIGLFGGTFDPPHEAHLAAFPSVKTKLFAVAINTFGYLLLTGTIAWVVFTKLGVSILRKAWLNLDFVWAVALIATAGLTLVFSWF